MHLYQLNDLEWWMAPSLEEAITVAMQTTGLAREEQVDETCHELTDAELDRLRFVYCDPETEEPDAGWPTASFREELANRAALGCGTEMFASREW